MDTLNAWLSKLPSTNARIAMTLLIVFGTAFKYWVSTTWEPSWEWLSFLLMMSGLDAAQFHSKRKTFAETERIKADAVIASAKTNSQP
jgi:hypothetical protein